MRIHNSEFRIHNSEGGQVILVLLLIMSVALAVGLSVVQRSVSDVSTSTKVEESARAFSAAEAGIERAIRTGGNETISESELKNFSSAQVSGYPVPDTNIKNFEIPSVRQEDPAHVWLVDSTDLVSNRYAAGPLDIYWGENGVSPMPAIEISFVSGPSGGPYTVRKEFYDGDLQRRQVGVNGEPANNFSAPDSCPSASALITHLTPTPGKQFACKKTVTIQNNDLVLRVRLIYTDNKDHPVGLAPVGSASLPQQGQLFISTGTSGETKRTIVLQKQNNVLPFFLDFVLFALSDINK